MVTDGAGRYANADRVLELADTTRVPVSTTDEEVDGSVTRTNNDEFYPRVFVRSTVPSPDQSNYHLQFAASGWTLLKTFNGASTQLGPTQPSVLAGVRYDFRIAAVGTLVRAKVWQHGTAEPPVWQVQVTDGQVSSGAVFLDVHGGYSVRWNDGVDWGAITILKLGAHPSPLRVDAGGTSLMDSSGAAWSADSGFDATSTSSVTSTPIQGVPLADQSLWQSSRVGPIVWTGSLPSPGRYAITLLEQDPLSTGPGQRVFSATANGSFCVVNHDIWASVGQARSEWLRCEADASTTSLAIAFSAQIGQPILSGILVEQEGAPIAPGSFINVPMAGPATVDPNSPNLVSGLVNQINTQGTWINTYQYSVPVYHVAATVPSVMITIDNHPCTQAVDSPCWYLQQAFDAVPLPADAKPAAGNDGHLVVVEDATDQMWEFWSLRRTADGTWHAGWGGYTGAALTGVASPGPPTDVTNTSNDNPGWFSGQNFAWGGNATSIQLLAGLITPTDLAQGQINHALAIGLPHIQSGTFRSPAQRTDGTSTQPDALAAGTWFRLDPAVNVASLPLSSLGKEIALAAQRYGIVVRDTSGAVTLYAQDPTPSGGNPYTGASGYFGGLYPDQNGVFNGFPWASLQVLTPPS